MSLIINRLIRMGANVIYNSLLSVHVSGHACADEMKMMISLIRPKYLIPVHGELRQLTRHKTLGTLMVIPAENIFVIENGQTLVFIPPNFSLVFQDRCLHHWRRLRDDHRKIGRASCRERV